MEVQNHSLLKIQSSETLPLTQIFPDQDLSLNVSSSALSILGQSDIKDFKIKLKTVPDKFIFTVGWDNRDTSITKGIITARGCNNQR